MSQYSGIKSWYFNKLLQTIVEVGALEGKRVLDFGCGTKELKKFLKEGTYVGYDIDPLLSDISTVEGSAFDVMVANEVFYEMSEKDIESLLEKVHPKTLVVGISSQGLLNKIGAALLHPTALDKTVTSPAKELEILLRHYRVVAQQNIWMLADVYLLERL